ncbi:MAG TPA: hypothetical protein VLJ60_04450, partial [bacterium]|nr:hypothetical protein [bacterium]
MKYYLSVIIAVLLILSGCSSADPEVECMTVFDCDTGFICVDNVCIKDENSKPVDENNDKNDDYIPVEDNNGKSDPDVVEKNDDDSTGGNKCTKDSDCDDENDCTENKCDTGYCFYPVKKEECNGFDDNCNDETDESFEGMNEDCDTGFTGKCSAGKKTCVEGKVVCLSPFHSEPEICNNEDDNCDGKTDNFKLEEMPDCPLTLGVCKGSKKVCDGSDWLDCTNESYGGFYSLEDELDDNFLDTNCDGVDGISELQIFVDTVNGDDDLNDGTIDNPLKTIAKGLETALFNGLNAVVVAKGIYAEEIHLENGVGIYGGFSGSPDWTGAVENEVVIAGEQYGVKGEEISEVTLSHLKITSADQTVPGSSSYAVFLYKSSAIEIKNSQLISGLGAAGADGADGAAGTNGDAGGKGVSGCEDSGGVCGSCSRPAAGVSGKNNVCLVHGGNGGRPGYENGSGDPGIAGTDGGGAGGLGGINKSSGNSCTSTSTSAVYSKGGNGSTGSAGGNGEAGISGLFDDSGYTPLTGGNGTDGTDARGGGGGGGGRGGEDYCDSYGSSGGGGGAGGCGGKTGAGGQGGGGSFGIYSIESTDIAVINTGITTAGGGNGGAGGSGGAGGTGGTGGAGGSHSGSGEQDDGGCGGWGGNGGAGGAGGAGG